MDAASVSVLRAAQTKVAFSTKDIAVEIGDPLPPARRNIEVTNRALDMRRYTAPIELGIKIGQIGRRGVPKLLVHPDFFELAKKSISLAQVMWVAQLTDQVGRTNEFALLAVDIPRAGWRGKACKFDGICNSGGIEGFDRAEAMHHEEL